MAELVGKCALCLNEQVLQLSHLLPRALYRLIGSGTDPSHPDTVLLTEGSERKSSEQARRHLLCADCEQRLNNNSERWVLRNCYRGRGRFRLRQELRTRIPLDPNPQLLAYPAQPDEFRQLFYFCLSVIWRASLCDWECRGQMFPQIELGPYQDQIRKYLKGEAGVPERVDVIVVLSMLEKPMLGMCLPLSYRGDSGHRYRFHIPGMMFDSAVGGDSREPKPDVVFIGEFGDRAAQDSVMHLIGRKAPPGLRFPLAEGTEPGLTLRNSQDAAVHRQDL
jgi:hypothetical protein